MWICYRDYWYSPVAGLTGFIHVLGLYPDRMMHWNRGVVFPKPPQQQGLNKLLRRVSWWCLWLTPPEFLSDGLVGDINKFGSLKNGSVLHGLCVVCRVCVGGRDLWKDTIPWILRFAFASVRLASKKFKALSEKERAVYQDWWFKNQICLSLHYFEHH